jgi:hypothetical protein
MTQTTTAVTERRGALRIGTGFDPRGRAPDGGSSSAKTLRGPLKVSRASDEEYVKTSSFSFAYSGTEQVPRSLQPMFGTRVCSIAYSISRAR